MQAFSCQRSLVTVAVALFKFDVGRLAWITRRKLWEKTQFFCICSSPPWDPWYNLFKWCKLLLSLERTYIRTKKMLETKVKPTRYKQIQSVLKTVKFYYLVLCH